MIIAIGILSGLAVVILVSVCSFAVGLEASIRALERRINRQGDCIDEILYEIRDCDGDCDCDKPSECKLN